MSAIRCLWVVRPCQPVTTVRTNGDGVFQVPGLKGGIYQISCDQNHSIYRVWSTNAAPPSASNGVLIIQPDSVQRGQCAEGCAPGTVVGGPGGYVPGPTAHQGMLGLLANPWIVGAAVAVAIAVPLALDDNAS